jgi:hypothetical protein
MFNGEGDCLAAKLRPGKIVLLFAGLCLANLRRMTHSAFDPEFFHQLQKPLH